MLRLWLRRHCQHAPPLNINPRHSFTCLSATVDDMSQNFIAASNQMETAVKAFTDLRDEFYEGGGVRGRTNHVNRNKKILPRERLTMLFDGGNYFEFGRLIGYGQTYGNIPQGGMIVGVGRVSERMCVASIHDGTVKGGTIYPINLRKALRFQEIAMQNRLPTVNLVDSGGAFLPLQSDIFSLGGKIFYNLAVLQSMRIPQISLVLGSCTAGGAYVPTMSEEMGMVVGIGHVFLGGPPLVKAATGEEWNADELGGAWLHSSVSGCSDYFFKTEEEGFVTIRDIVSTLPEQRDVSVNTALPVDPLYQTRHLRGLALNQSQALSHDHLKQLAYQIIARIFDASLFLEFKKHFGNSLIAGFARINGRMVGVLCSFGSLSGTDAEKGAHLVMLAEQRGLPLVCLTHTQHRSGVDPRPSPDPLSGEVDELRAKSKLMAVMATAKCIKVTVVVGDASDWDYYLMGAPSMSPNFVFAWPTARFGIPVLKSESSEETAPPYNALDAAGNVWIDDVILPENTRHVLSSVLDIASLKTELCDKAIPMKPVLRM